MKRASSLLVALALILAIQPTHLLAQATGEIAGTAVVEGKPVINVQVRLRNVDTNAVVATQRTNQQGQFRFTGLSAANYVVEIVSDDDRVLATIPVALTAGALISTGVTVSISPAVAAGAGLGVAGAAAGGGFFTTTAGLITLAVIGAGITAGIIAATGSQSPTR